MPPRSAARRSSARTRRARPRAPPASDASSPSAIAWTSRLPSSVASSGPASTGSPAAAAVQRQSSSLRAPPPTTWISAGAAPVTVASTSTVSCVLQREALEDAADDRAGLVRLGLAGRARRTRAIRAGMSPGVANARVVRVDERPQRRRVLRERDELVEGVVAALERPGAPALVQEPEPGDVAQQPERAADAALVGQVRREASRR